MVLFSDVVCSIQVWEWTWILIFHDTNVRYSATSGEWSRDPQGARETRLYFNQLINSAPEHFLYTQDCSVYLIVIKYLRSCVVHFDV